MAKKRIVYLNWIVDIGYDPIQKKKGKRRCEEISLDQLIETGFDFISESDKEISTETIKTAVKEALDKLTDEEKELIIRFHYMGETYVEMAEKTNREIYKLSLLHKQGVKKLKRYLHKFVRERYGIETEKKQKCLICDSEFHQEIDRLINNRDKTKSWKPVMKSIKMKYDLKITTPQILIAHEKYHL